MTDSPTSIQRQQGVRTYTAMYAFLYCMLASTVIVGRPVLGGAMYLIGQVMTLFSRLVRPGDYRMLPRGMRVTGIVLGVFCAVLALFILLIYPLAVELPRLWLVFALAFLVLLMGELAQRLEQNGAKHGHDKVRRQVRIIEMMLASCGAAALVLFFSQNSQTAWYLLGGYALCCVFALVSLSRHDSLEDLPQEGWSLLKEDSHLAQVNAYRVYRLVMMLTLTALQVTTILIFTFIGTTADSLFLSLAIAFVCTVLSQVLTDLLLKHKLFESVLSPSTTLLIGLTLWILSLISFFTYTINAQLALSFVALALCSAGVTMAQRALQTLEMDMRDVVRFVSDTPSDGAFARAQRALSEYAALIGSMIALVGLAVVTLMSGGSIKGASLTLTAQPLLLLPALTLVAAAILLAFKIPLDRQVVEKTRTFLRLKEGGTINIPLQKQLEDLVVKVHRKRIGIKLIIIILRPFFYSRVIGAETVKPQKDNSIIFTCNHGELWGPVVTNLFVPFSFRPWVIDEIAAPDESSTYLYDNTVKRQKWIPEKLKWPATKLVTAFLKWVMRSLDSIPVYRDNPRALVNTFRQTANAMEAGDNILIFPENPNDKSLDQPGYLKEGVGEFFNGFAMVAQIYHQRTGKRAQFYPLYADKKNHTITFGTPTTYDPDYPGDEKQRIADHLRKEMLRMAGQDAGSKDGKA